MPPTSFAGGDLEHAGVLEKALAARAPTRELVFISVADTRDHRRQHKASLPPRSNRTCEPTTEIQPHA